MKDIRGLKSKKPKEKFESRNRVLEKVSCKSHLPGEVRNMRCWWSFQSSRAERGELHVHHWWDKDNWVLRPRGVFWGSDVEEKDDREPFQNLPKSLLCRDGRDSDWISRGWGRTVKSRQWHPVSWNTTTECFQKGSLHLQNTLRKSALNIHQCQKASDIRHAQRKPKQDYTSTFLAFTSLLPRIPTPTS